MDLLDRNRPTALEQLGARFVQMLAPEEAPREDERQFPPFGPDWLQFTAPADWTWDWRWQLLVQEKLQKVAAGEIKRLLISIPIRHGKTELVTIRFSAWLLERDPTTRIILGAVTQDLANKFSREIKRIVLERGLKLRPDAHKMTDWQTKQGGGVKAAGVGTAIVGRGASCVILDDPLPGADRADSEVERERVWEWYKHDVWTRREPDAPVIVIFSRWHSDDLTGKLLQAQKDGSGETWDYLNLPALAEEDDPLGREPGQALCPDRFDEEALAISKQVLGRGFYALYQGRPQAAEGSLFKREWFRYFRIE